MRELFGVASPNAGVLETWWWVDERTGRVRYRKATREPLSTRNEPSKPSRLGGWSARVSDPGALVARLCDAAFLLHVSGGALRLVAPESHHAVKSAAALAGVRVAFSRPTKKRRRIRPSRNVSTAAPLS